MLKRYKQFIYDKHKVIKAYRIGKNNKMNHIGEHFSLNEKIDYYTKRINDKNLTEGQRFYAKRKLRMFKSGIGRIYLIKDFNFGNPNFPDNQKDRRVVVSSLNHNNSKVLLNGIYSNKSKIRYGPIYNYDGIEQVYILDHDSYVALPTTLKKNKEYFNINDLRETSSTISPLIIDDLMKEIYPGKFTSKKFQVDNIKKRKYLFKSKKS